MAIVTETYTLNGREFTRTYSDSNCYVVRDGIEYSEANDPSDLGRVYTEGDTIPSEETESDSTSEAEEIVNILTGGAV